LTDSVQGEADLLQQKMLAKFPPDEVIERPRVWERNRRGGKAEKAHVAGQVSVG
jgi:hypothetical protein